MAVFTAEFARGTLPPPTYESYGKEENVICHADLIPRTIAFNSAADYIVGLNFQSNYPPEDSIRIESFTDQLFYSDVGGGGSYTEEVNYVPSEMIDNSTGLTLTYPYLKPISELSDLNFTVGEGEMNCKIENVDYQRIRIITYAIIDSQGLMGELHTSKLITNAYI